MFQALSVLIVDDEALARRRIKEHLEDLGVLYFHEADSANNALNILSSYPIDVILLDIQMPNVNGLELAILIKKQYSAEIIFVTAYGEYALNAFEVAATDYLTKPVRIERLQLALERAQKHIKSKEQLSENSNKPYLVVNDRHGSHRIALDEIIYFKAELKYVTIRTLLGKHIFEDSLNQLQEKFPKEFIRIHRNALVAKTRIRRLRKNSDDNWIVEILGIPDTLEVSRRHLPALRQEFNADSNFGFSTLG
jgi:two-component system response regulator AlgR